MVEDCAAPEPVGSSAVLAAEPTIALSIADERAGYADGTMGSSVDDDQNDGQTVPRSELSRILPTLSWAEVLDAFDATLSDVRFILMPTASWSLADLAKRCTAFDASDRSLLRFGPSTPYASNVVYIGYPASLRFVRGSLCVKGCNDAATAVDD